jgi:hypothetical protein
LNNNGFGQTKAKRNILFKRVNRVKRIKFCEEMLTWDDEKLKRILWTDETMVKAYPNGEVVFYSSLITEYTIGIQIIGSVELYHIEITPCIRST